MGRQGIRVRRAGGSPRFAAQHLGRGGAKAVYVSYGFLFYQGGTWGTQKVGGLLSQARVNPGLPAPKPPLPQHSP